MNRNPSKIRNLKKEISAANEVARKLEVQLNIESRLPPVGYELISSGTKVKEGALKFEPYTRTWSKVNSNIVGEKLNDRGYIEGFGMSVGYQFANPEPFRRPMKGDGNYIPKVNETVLISSPNADDNDGYTYSEFKVLWINDYFILYGHDDFWPVLNKIEHCHIKQI